MNDVTRPKLPTSDPAATRSGRRPFIVLGVVVTGGLLALGGYMLMTADQVTTDDAQVEADVLPLAARIAGTVKQVLVRENQRVRAGELWLELDTADQSVRVAQAQADLAVAQAQAQAAEAQEQVVAAGAQGGLHSAKAQVSSSQVDVQSADSRVDVARAALERAQADARKADLDLERALGLRTGDAIAQEQLDSKQAASEAVHAALTQAQASLMAAQDAKRAAVSHVAEAQGKLAASTPIDAEIATAHAQTALARARIRSLQAALELAQLQLSYTKLAAPRDGLVAKLAVQAGQLVSANQPLAELVPSATYLVANFKETQIGRMRTGQRAKVELDAYPGRAFEAEIESLSGGTGARFSLMPADNASGNFVKVVQRIPVRLAWKAPPDVALEAGLSAAVTVYVRDPH
jgi:membrane fusion protein (multidrug efflux system)